MLFTPSAVYYEADVRKYPLGLELLERYSGEKIDLFEIDSHNKIEELRAIPDSELAVKKKVLVLGVRKSLRLVPNERSADFIVPFTSSGCPARCHYCYLMCTFFSNSYLRIFVNREAMWQVIVRKAAQAVNLYTFELGSNSDLVLEDSITGNLRWVIERFAYLNKAQATLATKFSQVAPLFDLDHRGKTTIRISVNPRDYIKRIEKGTAPLAQRVEAANRLAEKGYPVGINLAPVMLLEDWQDQYSQLLSYLAATLSERVKRELFFVVIFMTYGYANENILDQAYPDRPPLMNRDLMRPKGRGKLCYKDPTRKEAEEFLRQQLKLCFPGCTIKYVC